MSSGGCYGFLSCGGVQLGENRRDMVFNGSWRHEQPIGDFVVGEALIEKLEYFSLPGGETGAMRPGLFALAPRQGGSAYRHICAVG